MIAADLARCAALASVPVAPVSGALTYTQLCVVAVVQAAGAVPVLAGTAVQACPLCNTFAGEQVRAGIWNEQFWGNFLLTALPFPIFAVVIASLYFGPLPTIGTKRIPAVGTSGG